MKQLTINYHLNEACNYGCRYCYAAWKKEDSRELIHQGNQSLRLLDQLASLKNSDDWDSIRINFAGGEPLLYPDKLLELIKHARALGMDTSVITNASCLTTDYLLELAPHLSWLGISLDSVSDVTNHLIGRSDRKGKLLNLIKLAAMLGEARNQYLGMSLKINTVVNAHNHMEDFTALIGALKPEKWKALRMLPVYNTELAITDDQFHAFVERHRSLADCLYPEDNDDMRASYLMIDPRGRFFQNDTASPEMGYQYSRPVLEVGADQALKDIHFDTSKFKARYLPLQEGKA
jgi:radical S-adenosyl methionine domain-containing protein 2